MTTIKIVDITSRTEIKGRVRFVTRWTANGTDVRETLTDDDVKYESLKRGTTRGALIKALRDAERTNAARTANGNPARGYTTIYVRDESAPVSEGAWWPVAIAE